MTTTITAFAARTSITAPTSSVSTTGSTIKVAAVGGYAVIAEMLGANVVSCSPEPLAAAKTEYFMPVFGTDGNSAQDPWVHNAFYNTAYTPKVSNASTKGWVPPVAPITTPAIDATRADANDPLSIPILINRPDLIISSSSADKATLQASPYSYYSSDNSRYLTLTSTTSVMSMVSSVANSMQTVMNANGLTSRYSSSPNTIASNFNSWFGNNMTNVEDLVDGSDTTNVAIVSAASGSDWSVYTTASTDPLNAALSVVNASNIDDSDGVMTTSELSDADIILTTKPELVSNLSTATGKSVYVIPTGVFLKQWCYKGPENSLLIPWLAKKLHAGYGNVDTINLHSLCTTFYGTYCHYTGTQLSDIVDSILDGVNQNKTEGYNYHGSSVLDGSGDSTY